jgi:DNA-binding transcriptional regulator YiaG
MANLTKVLQDEIRRLARKEIRAQTGETKQSMVKQRQEIAALKKTVRDLQRQIAFLQSRESKRTVMPSALAGEMEGVRFSPRSVRAHRKRLKLSAESYAKLIGVSMQTIYHWEQGKSRPRRSQMAALVALRGIGRREALKRLQAIDSSTEEGTSAE